MYKVLEGQTALVHRSVRVKLFSQQAAKKQRSASETEENNWKCDSQTRTCEGGNMQICQESFRLRT